MNIQIIQSSQNKQFKEWKKLLHARGRKKQQRYLVEGIHLVEEALKTQQLIEQIVVNESYVEKNKEWLSSLDPSVYQLSNHLFDELAQTQTSQGIIAVVRSQRWQLPNAWKGRLLLVDGVQDPGNLGTMIRTAHAAGYDGVVLGHGTVDYLNEKVIRSTQGSMWHIPIYEISLKEVLYQLKHQKIPVYATALNQEAISYSSIDFPQSFGIILGNEGQGVCQSLISQADQAIYIPMPGEAESLNVAVATGILLFHSRLKF